jgi:ATP adenylyltransferase
MSEGGARGAVTLERGSLERSLKERGEHALRCGALLTIPTRCEVVEQGGVAFLVRTVASLEWKARARSTQRQSSSNPFLPYDPDLFVTDISDTHLCLLNKYNAVEHHLLIVTRAFEEQESPLTRRDFEALWACLAEIDGLAFYNAGPAAGASQRHKHLQLVPGSIGSGPERAPIESLIGTARFRGRLGELPDLPFAHAAARLDGCVELSPPEAAERSLDLYRELLRSLGCERQPRPYNLLATRDWMLLVPRTREACESIEVNALGFAGSLLARNREQLALVRRKGPMTILRSVAEGRD